MNFKERESYFLGPSKENYEKTKQGKKEKLTVIGWFGHPLSHSLEVVWIPLFD